MSIYIGNNLEDRLEALETENALLKKYNEYRQVVDEIDHTSDLHLDSSFHKKSDFCLITMLKLMNGSILR